MPEHRAAPLERLRFVGFAALAVVSGAVCVWTSRASRPPEGADVVELAFPLEHGRYLVVNGGTTPLINAHRQSMDTTRVNLRLWRGNGHAVDLIATDALGLRAPSIQPRDPTEYEIFGRPVLAPCDGSVVVAVDGLSDMPVPLYDRDHPAGNHLILECGDVHVVLGHLRRGSIRVHEHARVVIGTVLGEVGNSGGTDEPHLHIHAQRPGPPGMAMAGDPLPMLIAGRFLVRGDRVSISER
jgi:hypothetical protein